MRLPFGLGLTVLRARARERGQRCYILKLRVVYASIGHTDGTEGFIENAIEICIGIYKT